MTSFITKPKPKNDGTFWACKKCGKVPFKDTDIYMENIGTKEIPAWIACLDLNCFISQGGRKPDPNAKSFKAKSPEELFNYRKSLSELEIVYAKEKSQHVIGSITTEEKFKRYYNGIMGSK